MQLAKPLKLNPRQLGEQLREAVMAQHHIAVHAVAVGYKQLQDSRAVIAHGKLDVIIAQHAERHIALMNPPDEARRIQPHQVMGAGLNSTSALCSFQCSAQVFFRPLATSSIRLVP